MKNRQIPSRLSAFLVDQDGAIAIVIALLLPVLFGFAGLAVDIGHMYTVNSQLKNAADAGALSGARVLVPYTGSPLTPDWTRGQSTATDTVKLNRADNNQLTDCEVTYGYWNSTTSPPLQPAGISPTANDFPAVRVTVSKTAGKNDGPVSMYLASVLGVLPADVSATSVAIISFTKGVVGSGGGGGTGALKPMVATKDVVDKYWDKPNGFKFKIGEPGKKGGKKEKDDEIDAGMWTSFKDPANDAKTVKDLMKDGNPKTLQVGESIYLQPGEEATLYGDKNMGQFINQTVVLAVVAPEKLTEKTFTEIKDFIAFHITGYSQGGKYIEGYFDKDYVITNPQIASSPDIVGDPTSPSSQSSPNPPKLVN